MCRERRDEDWEHPKEHADNTRFAVLVTLSVAGALLLFARRFLPEVRVDMTLYHDMVFDLLTPAVLLAIAVLCLAGARSRRDRPSTGQARAVQELHSACCQVEQRVETLETLLLENGGIAKRERESVR